MLCNKSLYILLTNWLHILFKANLGNKFTTAADILSQIRDVFFTVWYFIMQLQTQMFGPLNYYCAN